MFSHSPSVVRLSHVGNLTELIQGERGSFVKMGKGPIFMNAPFGLVQRSYICWNGLSVRLTMLKQKDFVEWYGI